jgi:thiopeptide-type bacteriocin biosynthesis protein
VGGTGWDWGPLRTAPRLPRVVCGRLVLSRAAWQVGQQVWEPLCRARGAARFRLVQAWRRDRRMPRWVVLSESDNELPVDLDNVLAVDTLLELVKRKQRTTLVELFPGPEQLCVRGPEGRFVHELVIPLVRRAKTQPHEGAGTLPVGSQQTTIHHGSTPPPSFTLNRGVARSFPPGSEWFFAKLYSGPATTDQVLREVAGPVAERLLSAGVADRWFFVRYSDPDCHLRLRLHGHPDRLAGTALSALQAAARPLLGDRRLWRIQLDTYEREVERYGGAEGIVLAERLFHADSQAVLELAGLLAEDTRGDLGWRLALAGMDLLLADLDFDLEARRAMVEKMRDAFTREFHAGADFARQLAARFRSERKALESLLEPAAVGDSPLTAGLEVLRRRSQRLVPVAAELRACARQGRLSKPLTELAASFLHMHANRLLRSAHRAQELVLYDFLYRLYQSQTARRAEKEVGTHLPQRPDQPSVGARSFTPMSPDDCFVQKLSPP